MKVLDPNERKKLWEQIDEASRKLGVMTVPKLHVGMKVEKEGIVLCDQREEGHSWTRNMWTAVFGVHAHCGGTGTATFGAGHRSAKTTGGTIRAGADLAINFLRTGYSTPEPIYGFCFNGTTNLQGIVVGTGDAAFSVDNYNLATIIDAGSSAGQLIHNAMSTPSLDYTSKVWTATLARVFNNNSGGSITVKEVGIITNSIFFYSGSEKFLIARDVLASPVSVVNGAQLTATYEISMDFSSIDT